MSFKLPIELLPHRPPMIVISAVEIVDVDKGILTARADIHQEDILYQESFGGVPAYSAIEYMAQAIGCFVGYHDLSQGKKPGIGFVLGTRKLQIFDVCLKKDEAYSIDVKALFCDETIASFDCTIKDKNDSLIATAILNAYRPNDIEHFMKEYE